MAFHIFHTLNFTSQIGLKRKSITIRMISVGVVRPLTFIAVISMMAKHKNVCGERIFVKKRKQYNAELSAFIIHQQSAKLYMTSSNGFGTHIDSFYGMGWVERCDGVKHKIGKSSFNLISPMLLLVNRCPVRFQLDAHSP